MGPGLLVAATGVGAGDLATAGFAGSHFGMTLLWAVVLGAAMKFVLTEGLTRWQLATGQTLLEGAMARGRWLVSVIFLIYFLPWSYVTGAALISACGATGHALTESWGWFDNPDHAKLVLGVIHSVFGALLVWTGGYRLIERVMAACIGVMFLSTIICAIMIGPNLIEFAAGFAPRVPADETGAGLTWTIALMGGVGGTLTILCYGYWIREEGREGLGALSLCRADLAVGYLVTALFGLAMIVIASGARVEGTGTTLIVRLADQLQAQLGTGGRWIFLIGAWAAVFSSLLGVWQAVPYLFADFCRMQVNPRGGARRIDTRGGLYRAYLIALAIIPILHVAQPFKEVQRLYAVIGAAFLPLLALALLVMNGRRAWVRGAGNNWWTAVILTLIIAFFIIAGWLKLTR